ncbi:hypothetical protein [Rhizobium rhizogenes]|uniref:hypothetical protein n=1 Tax=Rhizobium rhizogenes TaxID=359 RepID=UPI001573F13B|nr:hypothetical protein [Rhizobium rhizogenes]NTG09237.1 hypothetical protein [Rhizobium rhizogenes]
MNTTDSLHEQIVDAIVDCPADLVGNIPALMAKLQADYPTATENEIFDCFEEAIVALEERAQKNQREANALHSLAPLFEGMPEGMSVGECARVKAERGDPLAISFLKWEAEQAGGLQ